MARAMETCAGKIHGSRSWKVVTVLNKVEDSHPPENAPVNYKVIRGR